MTDHQSRAKPATLELCLHDCDWTPKSSKTGGSLKPTDVARHHLLSYTSALPADDRITIDIKTATRISGLSRSTLYRLVDAGELKRVKVGGRTLLLVSDLRRLLQAKEV